MDPSRPVTATTRPASSGPRAARSRASSDAARTSGGEDGFADSPAADDTLAAAESPGPTAGLDARPTTSDPITTAAAIVAAPDSRTHGELRDAAPTARER